jgi:hypothetical protein
MPAIVGIVLALWQNPVWAADGEGQSGTVTSASATASGGTVTVGAGDETWSPAPGSGAASAAPVSGKSDPPPPSGCTYVVPPPQIQQQLGTGGQTPGEWVFPVNCGGPSITNPAAPFWVTNPQTAAAPVNPAALAQQALSKLPLAAPSIEMAPPASTDQLVNVSTWLWINPAAWQGLSATAAAGPVSATATAIPVEVVWNMGDGNQVTCAGPGTPYNPSNPNASTDCWYTWTQSSAGQPDGVYEVTATVYWQVAWTATGAPGGGSLGQVAGPAAQVAVRVAESQAVNTASGS